MNDFGKLQKGAEGNIVEGMSIIEDDNGKLWTAAFTAGAYKYDGKQEVRLPHQGRRDRDRSVRRFTRITGATLWLGTHNGGAYKFNGKTFERFRP